MTKENLISKLSFIKDKQVGLELYFLYKSPEQNLSILKVNLEDQIAYTRLRHVFIEKVKNQLLNVDEEGKSISDSIDWVLKSIAEVDELKNTIYHFPNEEEESITDEEKDFHIPDEFQIMASLHNLKYEDIPHFEHSQHTLENVVAFLIRLQIDNEQVIIYKHKWAIDVLSRTNILKMTNILQHATKFSLETDPLLKISDKMDFMFIDNSFIILNLSLLEQKYGFNERYLKKAASSLKVITNSGIVLDITTIQKMSIKIPFAKKLMRIKNDNEVLKTPIQSMKDFLDEYTTKDKKFSLAKRIKYVPSKNKFDIKTQVAAEDFLRLLNDQYLISLLTKRPYISDVQKEFVTDDDSKVEPIKKKSKPKKTKEKVA